MTSVLTVEEWLVGVLEGDATLMGLVAGVHSDQAPKGADYPLVEVSMVRGEPTRAVGEAVIWFDEMWQVKAVAEDESYASLGPVVNRLRFLLDGGSGVVAGGVVLSCIEVGSFRFSEIEFGNEYKSIGLELRVYSQ